jgi:hypothetical protein
MVLAGIVLLFGATASPAQSPSWANKLFTFKGGTEALVHNFGTVAHGTVLYYKFPMYNPWAIPIEITDLRVDCGCVTPKASRSILQPRETAYLETIMDTARRKKTGPTTITINVTISGTSSSPPIRHIDTAAVQVSANIRQDVVFNPGQISFGIVSRGQTPTQTVDVEYAGVLDWRVSDVVKNDAPIEVVAEELYRRTGRTGYREAGYRIKVTLKADAAPGPLRQELQLKTNDPASPVVPLLVEANIQAPLMVIPNPLDLGSPHVGETVTKRVIVRGNKPFRITGVRGAGSGDDLAVDLPPEAAEVQTLTLKWQNKNPGLIQQQLQIQTDLEPLPLTLTVKANVLP